ncbi:Dolichyl-phosphate-mannose-protein mannosyltransferase [Rubrobacter radiotolerans]|uniref:Dolichyl-phosphate-mannose-protein mannosyltransferase n=1 Tax=Rubrobacter radiotolerans TaxID=42256 RepID=A0A023X3R4_RUBRA|nr:glycosyltransferase family 39 protein [Rubrobacter radiotolerans]AHY47097.1 Dolichyl-phosphate-mannose-protein mannosyltransferase [Rubrobacter radiotolerans]MDX5894502.1 glycosyltransferase family 39 protein [Rubrobacter radiotolerans]SMC06136.1 Dolichyl-phosphate-mannose-protein mannosyltransferase [Rubrobacter radiotolerans DSM 5868]
MPEAGRKNRDTRWGALFTLALTGVVALAAGLRFFGLGLQSLWVDELASLWFADPARGLAGVVAGTANDVHPPGYHVVLYFTMLLLGDAEWAVRLPSAVAGTLAVVAIFFLGRELYSRREGLVAALFTAVFFAPVYYSQEARSYSLLLLFSVLTALLWWRVYGRLREGRRPAPVDAALYVAAALACSYLHYFGLFLVAFQGAALLALNLRQLRSAAWAVGLFVPVALLYAPWLPTMSGQVRSRELGAPDWHLYPSFLLNGWPIVVLVATALLAAFAVVSLGSLERRKGRALPKLDDLLPGALLVAWAVVPFCVAYYISEHAAAILSARNMIIALPAVYLLLARSVIVLFPTVRQQSAVALAVGALALYGVLFAHELYTRPHKQQVREAVAYVVERKENDPLVVHCGVGRVANYYYRQQGSDRSEFEQLGACREERLNAVREAARGHEEVVLVYAHLEPGERFLEALAGEYRLVHHEDLYDAGAYLYRTER